MTSLRLWQTSTENIPKKVKVKVLKQDSFNVITWHETIFDEVCRPMAVHFIVTRDSIADLCDNCNCLDFLEGVFNTNVFRTSRRNMTSGYKHTTNMLMLASEPLSMLHRNCVVMYWFSFSPLWNILRTALFSLQSGYLLPLCVCNHPNHCKNSAHIFSSLILLQLSLICKSHLWEPKAPRPGLSCCPLGLMKSVFIINIDHLGSEKINWKSFIILDQSSENGKVEYLWIVAIRNWIFLRNNIEKIMSVKKLQNLSGTILSLLSLSFSSSTSKSIFLFALSSATSKHTYCATN